MATEIILVEDHDLISKGIEMLINDIPNTKFIGRASNGEEAIILIPQHPEAICLIDINMPGMSGLELIAYLKRKNFPNKCMILSMYDTPEFVSQAMREGVFGYLSKDIGHEELEKAIQSVALGKRYFPEHISSIIYDLLSNSTAQPEEITSEIVISPRQKKVLNLLSQGHNSKEIADLLSLSPRTIEAIRSNMIQAYNVRNVTELVSFAYKNNLLD